MRSTAPLICSILTPAVLLLAATEGVVALTPPEAPEAVLLNQSGCDLTEQNLLWSDSTTNEAFLLH